MLSTSYFHVSSVGHVPWLTMQLFSAAQLTHSGCCVQDRHPGALVGAGSGVVSHEPFESSSGVTVPLLPLLPVSLSRYLVYRLFSVTASSSWSSVQLSSLDHHDFLGFISGDVSLDCEGCKLGNQIQLLILIVSSCLPFDIVHSDDWSPAPFILKGGHCYYIIFIDDFSRYTWLYFMSSRSEVLSIYKRFAAMVHTQFSTPIRVFRADSAGEYISKMLCGFLAEQGTLCWGTLQKIKIFPTVSPRSIYEFI